MKKILILSTVNLKHLTGASFYYNLFKLHELPFDILCVDKYGEMEEKPAGCENIYQFPLNFNDDTRRFTKLIRFISFRKYAKRIISKNQYSKIIVWGTETAILFSRLLKQEQYIINIRDYAHSDKLIIKNILNRLIKNAYFTTISSKGFESFLPKSNYLILNSFDKNFLNSIDHNIQNSDNPIRISFIGSVRFYDIDQKVLEIFANDNRFKIQFFGVGSEKLERFSKENSIYNVSFHGAFSPDETPKFINDSDLINNLYGFDNISLDTATSLKYFFSLYFEKPILVFDGTYMAKLAKNNIGYIVPRTLPSSLPDDIYTWYKSIDLKSYKKVIKEKIANIEDENKKLVEQTLTFVKEE